MCGIFGFFSRTRTISREAVLSSIGTLQHRGPDSGGVVLFRGDAADWHEPASLPEGDWHAVFAHRRLSIIDLTKAGNQPMSSGSCPGCGRRNGAVWIVYNGEIYNFSEIRDELVAAGHVFQSRTDSEVIVHGYAEWGTEVVHRLRGMFAFGLFDRKRNRLVLARDRLGVKPLKYFHDGETLIFASELKGLMDLVPRRMDYDGLNRFLTLKYIPSPRTIIEGVRKLLPGELAEYDMATGRMESRIYWKPEFFPKHDLSFDAAKEQFTDLLAQSVSMRTVSDVPIGVYLSGGMDSSAIVAFLREAGVGDINTFTIKFDRPGYDESEYARTVAERFGTHHHEFQVPELTFGEMGKIILSLDEPFGDPSYIPTWFLSRFTAPHVKVILSGDGGDEILGGYKRYFIYARSRARAVLPAFSIPLVRRLSPEINKKSLSGRMQRIGEELSLGYWGAYLLRFNGLSDSFKRAVMTDEAYRSIPPLSMETLVNGFPESGSIRDTIERLVWIDLHTYLPDYILTKTDLALMAHSVEGRNPLVDYRLVEFANRLRPEYKFRNGGKHILKSILEQYLPRDIIYRKKMGFSPPIKYWFRANTGLLHEIFSEGDFVSGDIFRLDRIHEVIKKFQSPEVNVSEQLWLIMVLELWRRAYRI